MREIERKKAFAPKAEVDITKLPEYMTYRKQRIDERKKTKVNYSLAVTKTLPRPNYEKTKPRYRTNLAIPDQLD